MLRLLQRKKEESKRLREERGQIRFVDLIFERGKVKLIFFAVMLAFHRY